MTPVKPLSLLLLLAATVLSAEPVQLRKSGNIVTFEYVTQDEDTITVQVPGKDSVLTYKWEDLDQEWTKKNSPKVWAERELLLKPAKEEAMEKKKRDQEPEEDPFAKVSTPTDTKSLIRSLSVSMFDGLKGVQIINVENILQEGQVEEATFWKTFNELKAASKPAPDAKEKSEAADKEMSDKSDRSEVKKPEKNKTSTQKSKYSTNNNPEKTNQRPEQFKTFEENAKKDYEAEKKSFAAIGYFRLLAEGGVKGKATWAMLRRAPDDRKAMVTMLRKYEAMAAELAEKPDARSSRNENLALKKHLQNAAEAIEKVNRETLTMELSLSNYCQTLLSDLPK